MGTTFQGHFFVKLKVLKGHFLKQNGHFVVIIANFGSTCPQGHTSMPRCASRVSCEKIAHITSSVLEFCSRLILIAKCFMYLSLCRWWNEKVSRLSLNTPLTVHPTVSCQEAIEIMNRFVENYDHFVRRLWKRRRRGRFDFVD